MDKKKLAAFKKRLLEMKAELEKEFLEIQESGFSETQSETSGENSYNDHFADSGTATFERERDLSLERNVKDILRRVDEALQKMEDGRYGICDVCGQEIGTARLKVLPYANLCIECKKKEETSW